MILYRFTGSVEGGKETPVPRETVFTEDAVFPSPDEYDDQGVLRVQVETWGDCYSAMYITVDGIDRTAAEQRWVAVADLLKPKISKTFWGGQ